MRIGTRSLLFGAHQFVLHPLMVAIAWNRLYGFPWDPRLWVSFFVHDWGYWRCPNMDGPEGELHPFRGAAIVKKLFGTRWGQFTLLHSRTTAKMLGQPVSDLCAADKLAVALLPWWVYVPMVRVTGEIREYKRVSKHVKQTGWIDQQISWESDIEWFRVLQKDLLRRDRSP